VVVCAVSDQLVAVLLQGLTQCTCIGHDLQQADNTSASKVSVTQLGCGAMFVQVGTGPHPVHVHWPPPVKTRPGRRSSVGSRPVGKPRLCDNSR
jgi:hypothetical protein